MGKSKQEFATCVIGQNAADALAVVEALRPRAAFTCGDEEFNLDIACAVVERNDRKGTPLGVVIIDEAAFGGGHAVFELLAFLRFLNTRTCIVRPKVFVLTEQHHNDPLFAQRFPGCVTHSKQDVLDGKVTLKTQD